jgi:hypothetical protein
MGINVCDWQVASISGMTNKLIFTFRKTSSVFSANDNIGQVTETSKPVGETTCKNISFVAF